MEHLIDEDISKQTCAGLDSDEILSETTCGMEEDDPMQFHPVSQGSSIILDMGGHRATRDVDSFCNGVVFSKSPLTVGSVYCLEVGSGGDWSGSLRLGVTIHSPTEVPSPPPRYACPDLIARDGYWARPVKESLAVHGARISFCLCPGGDFRIFVNNHHIGRHLTNIPTNLPVWALMDVYGNTTQVTFVKEESVPVEVLARGRDAVDAFLAAQDLGTLPIYRGRVCVLGQDRVGKTALVNALLSLDNPLETQLTEGIGLTKCWANSMGEWSRQQDQDIPVDSKLAPRSVSLSGLKADYDHSLAHTVANEIAQIHKASKSSDKLYSKLDKEKANVAARSLTSFIRSNLKNSTRSKEKGKSARSKNKVTPTERNINAEVPEPIASMVEDFLMQISPNDSLTRSEAILPNIQLDIWDFGGHPDLYTGHQLFLGGRALNIVVFDLRQELDSPAVVPIWKSSNEDIEYIETELTNLDFILVWLNLVYLSNRNNARSSISDTKPVTDIVIVGTNSSSLHSERDMQISMAELKFERIRQSIEGKPFQTSLCRTMFCVDSQDSSSNVLRYQAF